MGAFAVEIKQLEERTVYGVWRQASDRTVAADVKAAGRDVRAALGADKLPLPCYVLSRNYQKETRDFELLVGSEVHAQGLERLTIPAGEYASVTVRPMVGFLWGAAVGRAKRFFYTRWLPGRGYRPLNMEYEYHTQKSAGKRPSAELVFAVARERRKP